MIRLHVEPRVTKTWEQFCCEAPGCSIALDGYVAAGPVFNSQGPYLNLNHHEGVDRLATRSTAGQVFIYIKQGLFNFFRKEGQPFAELYVNDPDQDVSLAVWLLRNHERIEGMRSEPLINRLVLAEDFLDTTGGAYPFSVDSTIMRELAWIFDPYTSLFDKVSSMHDAEMALVIESVGHRIDQYVLGRGEELQADATYEILYQGTGWAMIREIGRYARTALFNAGVHAFISVKKESSGHNVYTLCKMSPFVSFPLGKLLEEYNRREGISLNAVDRWGGSNIVGGSPREAGSKIDPSQLFSLTEEFLRNLL